MDVNGNDNMPEWGWCKHSGCTGPAEPLWFSGEMDGDPDVSLCYKHLGQYVGALHAACTEAHRIVMESYTPDLATPMHEELLPLLRAAMRAL